MTAQRYDIQQIAVQEAGADGERLVWCGQPDPLRIATSGIPISLFAIPWTSFALFWVYAASGFQFPPDFTEGGFAYFPLFGVPFVLIGIGMLFTPLYQYSKAFRTVYMVTDKTARIIILGRTKSVHTFSGADLDLLQRNERKDGSGDLIFRNEISFTTKGNRKVKAIGFYGISHVRSVEQHLAKLRHALPAGS